MTTWTWTKKISETTETPWETTSMPYLTHYTMRTSDADEWDDEAQAEEERGAGGS